MKPSDFSNESTMGSIAQRHEPEVIAANVMKILARTGDTFRLLSWEEYTAERQKDGNFTERERPYFDEVVNYCASSHGAAAFCPDWAAVAMEYSADIDTRMTEALVGLLMYTEPPNPCGCDPSGHCAWHHAYDLVREEFISAL